MEENIKVSELLEALTSSSDDIIYIIQDGKSKQIKKTNLLSPKITFITLQETIPQNTDYEVPKYTLNNNSLNIFWEGCKLIKDVNYVEVDSTHIQFKDWDVPNNTNLELIIL